ncbi:non-hydrolyzing UDP-N-acetylglucosamine 2-epimerase [Spirosoma rhododendri]|uniref:UDP-N-acetylglucosamine 2-epimerase (Non-hydrolyzing) n=1 Tax=Spirosoma rhododendri TaxID=2728024 RepID=A0A7L5DN11_9BACT|nr:UDP-N-acetylglucosamine 2-epimerase (non-hydrolyzing) [Spirosoma rhododendri]QJD77447.1 UDP-N-acetylglucosamine 2-epimerase (non-hydrolyzing) [Spirosoma rhododendri]
MKILTVVGARPNFVKVAPLHRAFQADPTIESKLVHTGQHHDARMSDVFFQQFDLPQPDYFLGIDSGTPTRQTADILLRFEPILAREQPDWLVVVGDVTSTLACALVAARLGIRVAHVEAGLRSGDRQMPEEINRILTDHLADLLFVTEQAGLDNLHREGIPDAKVRLVGNLMIDSLVHHRPAATALNTIGKLGLLPKRYVLLTMHRPANVDTETGLRSVVEIVTELAKRRPVLFPLHPRTRASLIRHELLDRLTATPNVRLLDPQGYLEFLNLLENAAIVLTDSGGVQEETTYLNVPCLTLRTTTERPVTASLGTNRLIPGLTPTAVLEAVDAALTRQQSPKTTIPLWDGRAAERIVECLRQLPAVEPQ